MPLRRTVPRDPEVAAELRALTREIGKKNLALAQGHAAARRPSGPAELRGPGRLSKCHKAAVEFWKKTHHAQAWKTLVDVGKQYNYDCIGCHVTGWSKPGGVDPGQRREARACDVQCETCHGPGAMHVAEDGHDEPSSLTVRPAERLCADNCHTTEHSDTFSSRPYLRDVTGPGPRRKARKELGDGLTGHELRGKAIARRLRISLLLAHVALCRGLRGVVDGSAQPRR